MKIAVVGAGNVGRAVGGAWSFSGHDICYGVRDIASANNPPHSFTVRDAVECSDVVLLSVMSFAIEPALADCGDLAGKILIDPTNPLAPTPDGLTLAMGFDTSSAEFIAERTNAIVVKALNQVGASVLGTAHQYDLRPIQFVAADDQTAKRTVMNLVGDLGFEALDAGPLAAARLLEPMAMIWIDQAMRYGMSPERAWALVEPKQNSHERSIGQEI